MSIVFGVVRVQGENATEEELLRMCSATSAYAPDGTFLRVSGRVGMVFQPYHTHTRSVGASEPVIDTAGNMVVFDGRLDNHKDLISALGIPACGSADPAIILCAFSRWGENCFSKLIGEWALALWSELDSRLYLARDHAGTRSMYFSNDGGELRWSTYLETLITTQSTWSFNKRYLHHFICAEPTQSAAPYDGIHAVAPAQYIIFGNSSIVKNVHWECSERLHLRCTSENEYVEGFLSHLNNAVARRSSPGDPVVAQLSGGMDSSAIVCISDHLRRSECSFAPLLDTISFYDDAEPNWNEYPYFSAVEAQRGKSGLHIPLSFSQNSFLPAGGEYGTYLVPGADSCYLERELTLKSAIGDRGYRVVLSGHGGDEVLGGNPDPFPDLASALVSGDGYALIQKSIQWSLQKRTTLLHILSQTVAFTTKLYRDPVSAYSLCVPPWLLRNRDYEDRPYASDQVSYRGKSNRSPNDICNRVAWHSALTTLPNHFPEYLARYEYRYPLLDRDLVDFVFSLPREQVVRPGRRRYLMRKALQGIVPTEILERKRKAFIATSPIIALRFARSENRPATEGQMAAAIGLIDADQFRLYLDRTMRGGDTGWMVPIMRTIAVELWLLASLARAGQSAGSNSMRIVRCKNNVTEIRQNVVAC